MKKEPKKFKILGPSLYLQAILPDLLELGYTLHKYSDRENLTCIITNQSHDLGPNELEEYKVLLANNDGDQFSEYDDYKTFNLPQGLNQCLFYARTVLQDAYWDKLVDGGWYLWGDVLFKYNDLKEENRLGWSQAFLKDGSAFSGYIFDVDIKTPTVLEIGERLVLAATKKGYAKVEFILDPDNGLMMIDSSSSLVIFDDKNNKWAELTTESKFITLTNGHKVYIEPMKSIKANGKTFDIDAITRIFSDLKQLHVTKFKISGFDVSCDITITIGCWTGITQADLANIISIYNKITN